MPFEAYHTARRRQLGHPVDEFSSLISVRGANSSPLAPILLIGFGVLFLLNNLDVIRFYHLLRYWPVFLIALGVYLLYARFSGPGEPITRAEVADERQ
jgi:hypothetical protein